MNTINNLIVKMITDVMVQEAKESNEISKVVESTVLATSYLADEGCIISLFPSVEEASKSITEHANPEQYAYVKQQGRTVVAKFNIPEETANIGAEMHVAACKFIQELNGAPYMDNPEDFYNLI